VIARNSGCFYCRRGEHGRFIDRDICGCFTCRELTYLRVTFAHVEDINALYIDEGGEA